MSGWGIAETAPVIEKIKAESADYLRGLNCCGDITWGVYDKAFDFYMELISRAYEQGKKDAEPHWILWNSGKFPEESGTYIVTAYDGVKERVAFAKYQKRLKRWELTGARAYWRVLAWMPLPGPWRGEEHETD